MATYQFTPDGRRIIPKLEFYITNVCNLTCQGCNRFNDMHFRGWQRFSDYADVIAEWGKKITIDHTVLMGGEPLLNPTICDWLQGLRKIGQYGPQIMSNGTYIDRVDGLYETLRETHGWIGVSLHHRNDADEIYQRIRNFYPAASHVVEVEGKENTRSGSTRSFCDQNNIWIEVWNQTDFVKNAVRYTAEGRPTLHNNTPESAFVTCAFAANKNYHFIRGKLYRCGPVGLFPELDDQFDLDLSPEDKVLLRSYRPLSVENYAAEHELFFDHIDDMIPQCKFCCNDDTKHALEFRPKKTRVNLE